MTKLKLFLPSIVVIAMCSLALLFSPVHGHTIVDDNPPYVMLTSSEYNESMNNLNKLETESIAQQERTMKLEALLQTALLSTSESNKALIEAKAQTQEQANQLQKLNDLLMNQSKDLAKANESLVIANQYSNELERELKKERKKDKRNKMLLVVAGATAIYFAAK